MDRHTYLFVYGSLRARLNHPAHEAMARGAVLISGGTFRGKLYHLGPYPAAVESGDPADTVTGEIYKVREDIFAPLDEYEGPEFARKRVTVSAAEGRPISCWIYLYKGPVAGFRRIPSGDYVRYRNLR